MDDRSDIGGRGGEAFPEMVRMDWMQDLLEWFDWYLKGEGREPGLHIEIQSNQGQWRIEDRYPADNLDLVDFTLGGGMQRTSGGTQVLPDASTGPVYETEPLADDMYIQGLTQYMLKYQQVLLVDNYMRF